LKYGKGKGIQVKEGAIKIRHLDGKGIISAYSFLRGERGALDRENL